MTDDRRTPVIIGVGEICDRPDDPFDGLESRQLMHAAIAAAERDSTLSLRDKIDWLGVEDQISFPDPEIADRLASELPSRPPRVVKTEDASGDGPVRLINDAANLIAEGEISVAVGVGGEALRTANKRAQIEKSKGKAPTSKTNLIAELAARSARPLARAYGLLTPIDVYPLYENATRAAWGQTFVEAQAETAAIWSGFSQVASQNPMAWLRTPKSEADILCDDPGNPMLSFPYRKLMVANGSVNMGAAVIVTSLAFARENSVPENRIVYVGRGAASHEPDDFLARDSYEHSASLSASISKTLEFNGLDASDIDCVELYSCFPCIPKMARRVLNWPLSKPHSVYGGLTFGGGPIGNCMAHAAARMVLKLRGGDRNGMIVANGGYATHNHAIVLSGSPARSVQCAMDYRVDDTAATLRKKQPALLKGYEGGPGTIETFVAPFARDGRANHATIVARNEAGDRFLATIDGDDRKAIERLTASDAQPVGCAGMASPMPDGRLRWDFRS
ncbi:acetyl-CoA acetyltransferase [Croceicoccus sediminis]|uniref:acetyl-CoA acetyltransferase n=1 Tax=Croceicoccus sediminis TaxID=2571150 RepID=UPI00118277AA|nr:acetyl-CoA acetyltransferase [Croceicoccus sediminis]